MLFGYLRAEPLFQKFTLFSPLSYSLILASPIFAASKNIIAQHLCAFQISKSRTVILKIYPGFLPESLSDFGITNFIDIEECNCATFMCFSCASRISKNRTAILKIYPVFTPQSPSNFGITNFCDIKQCKCAAFMCFLCAS